MILEPLDETCAIKCVLARQLATFLAIFALFEANVALRFFTYLFFRQFFNVAFWTASRSWSLLLCIYVCEEEMACSALSMTTHHTVDQIKDALTSYRLLLMLLLLLLLWLTLMRLLWLLHALSILKFLESPWHMNSVATLIYSLLDLDTIRAWAISDRDWLSPCSTGSLASSVCLLLAQLGFLLHLWLSLSNFCLFLWPFLFNEIALTLWAAHWGNIIQVDQVFEVFITSMALISPKSSSNLLIAWFHLIFYSLLDFKFLTCFLLILTWVAFKVNTCKSRTF